MKTTKMKAMNKNKNHNDVSDEFYDEFDKVIDCCNYRVKNVFYYHQTKKKALKMLGHFMRYDDGRLKGYEIRDGDRVLDCGYIIAFHSINKFHEDIETAGEANTAFVFSRFC